MNFTPGKKILIVAAHPDDEILGMGGTLAKATEAGCKTWVLFLGEGISARFTEEQYGTEEYKKQTEARHRGAKEALSFLGVENFFLGTRLCTQFDKYPLLSIVKEIEKHIDEIKPDMLFTHNPVEVNVDHKITYQAVESACRPVLKNNPKEIYTFEIVCSGSWKFEESFKPNIYVDISEYWQKKIKAWHFYSGEERPFPFPRSDQGLETLAQYRGIAVGLKKAEGFRLVRMIA